jgi:O-antigen/teichoic acid export membrane protein
MWRARCPTLRRLAFTAFRRVATNKNKMGVRQRFLRGFWATALGPVVTIMVQVIGVPVFLHSWGARLYGEWLILSAIPTYLAFSDVGFGSVAANDMTMRVASGDREGALETFQSTWLLISLSSVLAALCLILGAWALPITHWLKLTSTSPLEARRILFLLFAYGLLSLQADLITSGFRCEGNYALGMLSKNTVRLVESVLVILAVAFHAAPIQAAAAYLILRVIGTAIMSWLMLRTSPWLRYGFRHATLTCTRRLAVPALAYIGFPAGNALSLQGMVLIVGVVLGPIAVATFATMRTLTRFGFQIMESVKNTLWPELSIAYGAQNWTLARRLHRVACQASLWSSLATVVFLFFAGDRVMTIWTRGRIVPDEAAFRWLLLVVVATSFWHTSSVVTIASNTHERVAAVYLAGTAASLVMARLLMPHFGISGAAMALLASAVIVGWYVLSQSLKALSERMTDFFASMFRLPEFSFWK